MTYIPKTKRQFIYWVFSGFWFEKMVVLIGGGLVILFGIVVSFCMHTLIDVILPEAQRGDLIEMVVWLGFMILAIVVFQWVRAVAVVRLTMQVQQRSLSRLWERLLHMPLRFFRVYSVGDLVGRMQSLSEVLQFYRMSTVSLFISGVFCVVVFGVMVVLEPLLMVKLGLFFGFACALLTIGLYRQYRLHVQLQVMTSRLAVFSFQIVTGISKIKTAHAYDRIFSRWMSLFLDKMDVVYRYRLFRELQALFFLVLPTAMTLGVLWHMDLRYIEGTIGRLFFIMMMLTQWAVALGGLYWVVSESVPLVSLFARLEPLFVSEVPVSGSKLLIPDLKGGIDVEGVSFAYVADHDILMDLSFSVQPGQFVAIVGPSGCGKSTLLNVLLGFEIPTSGSVFYDGYGLSDVDLYSLRRSFGVVLQDGGLFSGDILSTIVGGLPVTIDMAWEAARLAGIDEAIRGLPMGMHTLLTDSGKSLSGGQRQQLMLARALVNRPRILFLDEATSALDSVTQARIAGYINDLQITRIVVAHRLSTISNADMILVMSEGRIVQRGCYADLMADQNGLFWQLASRQVM